MFPPADSWKNRQRRSAPCHEQPRRRSTGQKKTWPQARAEDFEPVGKTYIDRASGVAYRRVPGDPQLGGAGREDIDVWFVSHDPLGDGIAYLRADNNPGYVVSVVQGEIGGRPATSHEGGVR